jgi:hypothetical protein
MKTASTKAKKTTSRKKSSPKAASALSICPVNGAGWCPYPFSANQLKKRLKKMQAEQEEKELVSTSKSK